MSGNMFEDRMKEKEAEIARARAIERRLKIPKNECVREASRVSDHLVHYIGMHPNIYAPTIEVGVEDNRVTVRSSRFLMSPRATSKASRPKIAHGPNKN